MNKFHSTISRRDFMKGLGLAGAGLGAAAATAPVFRDMDEVLASPQGMQKWPWWVKERDFNNPTTEIDINNYPRFDRRHMYDPPYDEVDREKLEWAEGLYGFSHSDNSLSALKARKNDLWIHQSKQDFPGMQMKDQSLYFASQLGSFRAAGQRVDYLGNNIISGIKTPEERGLSKWQGTPEENLRLIRVAGRYFGAYTIGVVEMNDFNKHFTWSNDGQRAGQGRDIFFEDIDEGYETSNRRGIPNNCRYGIVMVNRHPEQTMRAAPGCLGNASMNYAYKNQAYMYAYTMRFLRSLGYQAYYNSFSGAQAYPALAGLGEKGRPGLLLTPGRGALIRKMDSIITDLPLTPTPPIDAGQNRFCHTCKKCADRCPTGAIPTETEPSWEVTGPWNATGIKDWSFNYPICGSFKNGWAPGYCGTCLAVCPFSKLATAPIHEMVQGTSAVTGIFNGFLRNMDDFFGYGKNLAADQSHQNDNYIEEFWDTFGPEFGMLTFEGTFPTI
jgi:reductive dehalogenase